MDNNSVILITPNDEVLGTIDKMMAHRFAMLHRAFSVFVYRMIKGNMELLLQQRQMDKYHCGGLWTNTCCSHPTPGEELVAAGERRLLEEIGVQTKLSILGKFHYVASLDNDLFENELDYVLSGLLDAAEIPFNRDEVNAVKWVSINDLHDWLAKKPEEFTPWFCKALTVFLNNVGKL